SSVSSTPTCVSSEHACGTSWCRRKASSSAACSACSAAGPVSRARTSSDAVRMSSALDFRHERDLAEGALNAHAVEKVAGENAVLALRVDGPGVTCAVLGRAADGLHELEDDVVEGVD